MTATATESTYARIYAVVRRIPKGRVATYGQVAELADLGGHARQVGYALSALPDESKATAETDAAALARFTEPEDPDFWRSDNPMSPAYQGAEDPTFSTYLDYAAHKRRWPDE